MQLKLHKLFILFLVIFLVALGISLTMNIWAWWIPRNHSVTLIAAQRFSGGDRTLADIGMVKKGEPAVEFMTATFSAGEVVSLSGEELAIFIPGMNGQGYRVYLNGTLIGSAGDAVSGRANIWNSSFLFTADRKLLAQENELSLEIFHLYEYGTPSRFVMLSDPVTARWMHTLHELSSSGLTLIGMGLAFGGCILILLMSLLHRGRRKAHFLFVALSLLSLMVYSVDYLPIASLPMSYLAYKKIVMSCLFLCVATTGLSIGHMFRRQYLAGIPGAVTMLIFAVAAACCREMIDFKKAYNLMLVMLPVNMAMWLAVILPHLKKSEEANVYFTGLIFAGLYAGYTTLVVVSYLFPGNSTPFIFIVIYMCLVFLLFNIETARKNVLIAREAEQSTFFYRQSITDGLTGLYKNTYLVRLIDEMGPPYAVAMIDGDHFKEINDRHGHPIGNLALIHIAESLRRSVREKDVIARYGGDEFLVLLRDCSHQGAVACMERFRELIQNTPLETENRTVSMTVSVGLCHSNRKMSSGELIAQADKALYKAKQTGRNRLCSVELGREEGLWSGKPDHA